MDYGDSMPEGEYQARRMAASLGIAWPETSNATRSVGSEVFGLPDLPVAEEESISQEVRTPEREVTARVNEAGQTPARGTYNTTNAGATPYHERTMPGAGGGANTGVPLPLFDSDEEMAFRTAVSDDDGDDGEGPACELVCASMCWPQDQNTHTCSPNVSPRQ